MLNWPILSTITFLPLIGAAIIFFLINGDEEVHRRNMRHVALGVTVATFFLSLLIWIGFDFDNPGYQFTENADWFGNFMRYEMGIDGISMLFIILTTFLMPFAIWSSFGAVQSRVKEFMVAFLVLETLMIGVFCALDIVLFYVFFEAGLIPMFLIIGVWGGKRRVYAAFKFFLYTLLGSVLMLLAIMAMYWNSGTTSIPEMQAHTFPAGMQT
ncbi:MAG: proton-conducting transporter transmembrane domain-containing protein, partial [Alphaproteobacteria bacterium]